MRERARNRIEPIEHLADVLVEESEVLTLDQDRGITGSARVDCEELHREIATSSRGSLCDLLDRESHPAQLIAEVRIIEFGDRDSEALRQRSEKLPIEVISMLMRQHDHRVG